MNINSRIILQLVVVFTIVAVAFAGPVSAAPTDRDGEARTIIATPGQPTDQVGERTTQVTGEIILGEDRDEPASNGASGTITIDISVPESVPESNDKAPDGRKIVREVGHKK